MLAAPSIDSQDAAVTPSRRWAAPLLSALLHLLLALVWLGFPWSAARHQPEPAFEVELAPEAPRPEPAPPSAAAPAAKPAGGGDSAQGTPIPQLEEGLLAQRSSKPRVKTSEQAPPDPRAEIATKPKKPEPVTQNERDFVLGQVLRQWAPPRELADYAKADVRVSVEVGADGYFTDIYDARRPWNPDSVFDGYSALPPGDIQRRTVDAFYRAIRQAQPVRLPPQLKAKAPFSVRLDFRFRDAR